MTEREKMAKGLPYNSADPEISEIHMAGKKLMRAFNDALPEDTGAQRRLLAEMLGGIGTGARVNQPLWIDYGCNIFMGRDSFINMNCTLLDAAKIIIGERTLIAPDVKIYTALHPVNGEERYTETGTLVTRTKPVVIGRDTWIGGGSVILPGVTIGNNVTVGAGSVVTRDIPDNTVAYGNPCRVRRRQAEKGGSQIGLYKAGKFALNRIPYLHGLYGLWRRGERTAHMDHR